MTIKVSWFNPEKTIILQKRETGWTWQDFDAAVDQFVELARSVDHKTAIIVDCLNAPDPPSSAMTDHYIRMANLKPQNLVRMVVVSEPGGPMETARQIYSAIAPIMGRFLHFVHTLKEAEGRCYEVLD